MYIKYTMEIVQYHENDFIVASGLDEGEVEGPELDI